MLRFGSSQVTATEPHTPTTTSVHTVQLVKNETKTTDAWYISDLSSGFTIGSTYSLMLLPAPVDLNGTNMDCAYLAAWTDADTGAGLPTNGTTPAGGVIYEFDGTPMTLSEDLTLDGCVIRYSALHSPSRLQQQTLLP